MLKKFYRGIELNKNNELDSFFDKLFVIEQEYNIIPQKKHRGLAIKYIDMLESREEFIDELINNVVSWVYGNSKYNKLKKKFMEYEHRSEANANTKIIQLAKSKFRKLQDKNLLNGQFGELILFLCLKYFFNAEPILRKMPICTSNSHERFGADAIHLRIETNGKYIIYLGEAKSYISNYKFNVAFKDAVDSVIKTYETHRKELDLYIYEDYIEKEYQEIAEKYKNCTLENVEVHLVNIVIYNETEKINKSEDVKKQIEMIIKNRYEKFDFSKINTNHPIVPRINYIIFPIWEFSKLLDKFFQNL